MSLSIRIIKLPRNDVNTRSLDRVVLGYRWVAHQLPASFSTVSFHSFERPVKFPHKTTAAIGKTHLTERTRRALIALPIDFFFVWFSRERSSTICAWPWRDEQGETICGVYFNRIRLGTISLGTATDVMSHWHSCSDRWASAERRENDQPNRWSKDQCAGKLSASQPVALSIYSLDSIASVDSCISVSCRCRYHRAIDRWMPRWRDDLARSVILGNSEMIHLIPVFSRMNFSLTWWT